MGKPFETRVGGFRVIGPNTGNGDISSWAFPTLEAANTFAKQLSEQVYDVVEVAKMEGIWRPTLPPVEFTPADKLR